MKKIGISLFLIVVLSMNLFAFTDKPITFSQLPEKAQQFVNKHFDGVKVLSVQMDDNEYDEIVMPDATRYISRKIDHLANLGVYDITQSVEYVNGEVNTVNQTLFIMPIWFIVLLILTAAAFIATIIRLVKRRYETKVELDAPHPLK